MICLMALLMDLKYDNDLIIPKIKNMVLSRKVCKFFLNLHTLFYNLKNIEYYFQSEVVH